MEFLNLYALLFFVPLFFFFLFSSKKPKDTTKSPKHLHVGYLDFLRHLHRLTEWTTEYLVASPTGIAITPSAIFVADPATVEHVTKTRFENYVKGPFSTEPLQDFLRDGIFNTNDQHWIIQRKGASHEFNTKSIRTFVLSTLYEEITNRFLPILNNAVVKDEVIDMQHALNLLGMDNIGKMAMDVDLELLTENYGGSGGGGGDSYEGVKFAEAFEESCCLSIKRFASGGFWKAKKLLRFTSERKLKKSISIVDDYILKAIRARKQKSQNREGNNNGNVDILSRFIEDERDYSDEYLRDIIISFILAGRDTTTAALTWFFWILMSHKDVEKRILDEIASIRRRRRGPSSQDYFTLEELRDMHYLHAALSESLRLYPPVSMIPRSCVKDDVFPDNTPVKKGTMVMISMYAMARREDVWGKDCEEFRPERWLDKDGMFQPANVYKYHVFHGGPRMCLGKDMAFIQMKVLATAVLERFEMEIIGTTPKPCHVIVLKMEEGLPVRLKPRVDLTS